MDAKKLDVPFQFRETWYFCGPTSLSLVTRYNGIHMSPAELAILLQTNTVTGTVCMEMASVAREIGLWVFESWHATADDLRTLIDQGVAPIIFVLQPELFDHGNGILDQLHYYIVTGYGDGFFTIHDTDSQVEGEHEHARMSEEELAQRWTAEPNVKGRWMLGTARVPIDDRWLGPRFTGAPITA